MRRQRDARGGAAPMKEAFTRLNEFSESDV
jgi:hypothetical protein